MARARTSAKRPALVLRLELSDEMAAALLTIAKALGKPDAPSDPDDVVQSTDTLDGPEAIDTDAATDHGCDADYDHDADAPEAATRPRRVGFRVPKKRTPPQ